MIVCHCKKVTSQDIKAAILAGACSERDVAEATGAGLSCGGCGPTVQALVDKHVPERRRVYLPLAG